MGGRLYCVAWPSSLRGQASFNRVRDDINKLPLTRAAKAYARRTGLKSMMDQPKAFMRVNAQITNPGKRNVFKNSDVGVATGGGRPSLSIKDSAAFVVNRLLC